MNIANIIEKQVAPFFDFFSKCCYIIYAREHNGKFLGRDTLVQLKVENLEPYF